MQILNANDKKNLPDLTTTEGDDNPMVWAKIYNPVGDDCLFLAEYDGFDTVFAFQTVGGEPNAQGYYSLTDLARNRMVRDTEWTPKNLSDAIDEEKSILSNNAIEPYMSGIDVQESNKIKISSLI